MDSYEYYYNVNNGSVCLELVAPLFNDTQRTLYMNNCMDYYDPCSRVCHEEITVIDMLESMIPKRFGYPIYGVAFPILLTFLVIANVFVVLVLSKKHMASPTNTVLFYMAISDFFVGVVPFPFTFFYFTLGYYNRPELHEIWWCYMGQYLVNVLPPVCHGVAIWLTVLLAAQRYVYIQYPLAAQKWCTIPKVRHAAFFLTVLAVLSGVLKVFEYTFKIYDGYLILPNMEKEVIEVKRKTSCASEFTSIVKKMTPSYFYNIYMWTRVIGFLILPSVILIILNILLIIGLRKAQERRNRLLKENRQREANRQKESNSTNLMLVIVVSIFLIVNLPQALFLAMISVDSTFDFDMDFFKHSYANLFVMIDNMLIMATYPVNFAIYCSMSTQFRETFKRIFRPSLPPMPKRQGSVMVNNASYAYLPVNSKKRMKLQQKQKQQKEKEKQSQQSNMVKNGIVKIADDANSQDDML